MPDAKPKPADVSKPIIQEVKKSISNAPKKQPCDNCHRQAKRVSKTKHSATYLCNVCRCKTVIMLRG